MVNLVLQAVVF